MKKIGFTLAEVLITLTIIGVIASVTIPVLFNDINQHTWVGGLRTSSHLISEGFAEMLATEQVYDLTDTTLWDNLVSSTVKTADNNVRKELGKYFAIRSMETIPANSSYAIHDMSGASSTNPKDSFRVKLANSQELYMRLYPATTNKKSKQDCDAIKANGGSLCNNVADVYIDVNGLKGPNTIGKDIFFFLVGSDGRIYPYGGTDANLYDSNIALWTTNCSDKKISDDASCDSRALTARVIDEGYKMTYK